MRCPNCNKEVPNGSRFCNHCAYEFEQENTIKCTNPDCGHKIPADSKFCPDCGFPVGVSQKEEVTNCLTFTVNGISFTMIRVEHGEFIKGSNVACGNEDATPSHNITLTCDYYMGETPVTQALWRAVMKNNPLRFGEGGHGTYTYEWEELPVEQVSWSSCQEFMRHLKRLTGKIFRLPTEAEWEFAARGGKESCGYQYSGSDDF